MWWRRFIDREFDDRSDAGRQLAERLQELDLTDAIILALPRGGVAVGYEIARALHAPLDVLLVSKIGAPTQPELAVGAAVDAGEMITVWNDEIRVALSLSREWCHQAEVAAEKELDRQGDRYAFARPRITPRNRTAIIVDDGIATGASVRAAIQAIREVSPERLLLAVPVAPRRTLQSLSPLVDEIFCLSSPDPFAAVGQAYHNFEQLSDADVIDFLRRANAHQVG